MEPQKPPPPVETSLKYMAWDVKRTANALEAIQKAFEAYAGIPAPAQEQAPKRSYKGHHRDEEAPF